MIQASITFVLALIALALANTRALRVYFSLLALYQFPCWWVYLHARHYYFVVFVFFTATLLAAEAELCIESYRWSKTRLLTMSLAIGIGLAFFIAYYEKTHSFGDFITIVESVLLSSFGIIVGLSAPHSDRPMTYGTLGLMFLAQAYFGLGYVFHFGSEAWYESNQWIPAFINIVGVGWIDFHTVTSRKRLASHAA